MRTRASSLRRKLFIALLVLVTLLPLVVYVYLRERGRSIAAQRLAEQVERSVARALRMKEQLEPLLARYRPEAPQVRGAMERLVATEEAIAYLQLADNLARVLNSTYGAPVRNRVPLTVLPLASPDIARRQLARRSETPEFVVGLRNPGGERFHMVVGLSLQSLEDELAEFQRPLLLSSLQIAVICMAMLAGFSAYIVYVSERARSLHAQLQEESRLAYVGTLAAGIAHEVRNPLSSVKMNVQMMENRLAKVGSSEDADYLKAKVERIKGEVERLESSVNHFLAFARPAPLRLETTQVNDIVDNTLELLQPQCQSGGVQLVRKLARDLPPVQIDPRQFVQAVENLVLNAMQASGRGGTVTVATTYEDGAVVLAVSDDGPGIPPELQERIFNVFFTTRQGGTGLGLNIVSRIVEEHHFRLDLDSEVGRGTTFKIIMPLESTTKQPREEK